MALSFYGGGQCIIITIHYFMISCDSSQVENKNEFKPRRYVVSLSSDWIINIYNWEDPIPFMCTHTEQNMFYTSTCALALRFRGKKISLTRQSFKACDRHIFYLLICTTKTDKQNWWNKWMHACMQMAFLFHLHSLFTGSLLMKLAIWKNYEGVAP